MYRLTSDNKMLEYGLMKAYSNISCFSTTRYGGCSKGNYASLNCMHYCGDSLEDVKANREILMNSLSLRPQELIIPHQTHSDCVKVIDEAFFALSPSQRVQALEGVDALVTSMPGCCICISTADCVPVMMYDTEHQVVAVVHAGWRGTVNRIVEKTLRLMKEQYGTCGKAVIGCIGPSISLDSFEVGDEVYQAFADAHFEMDRISRKEEKWHLDLWEANRLQLVAQGVDPENVEVSGICTFKEFDRFFSARRMGINSGRILSGIMLHQKE